MKHSSLLIAIILACILFSCCLAIHNNDMSSTAALDMNDGFSEEASLASFLDDNNEQLQNADDESIQQIFSGNEEEENAEYVEEESAQPEASLEEDIDEDILADKGFNLVYGDNHVLEAKKAATKQPIAVTCDLKCKIGMGAYGTLTGVLALAALLQIGLCPAQVKAVKKFSF